MARLGAVREESAATRRRLTKDERRTRILEAAARVFAERGYASASLDEIAEAAGISKPVIYDHFASKKELQIELLQIHTQELLEFTSARVLADADTTKRALEIGFGAFFEFAETHPYAWRVVFRDPSGGDPELDEAAFSAQRQATAGIAALVAREGMKEAPGDPPRQVMEEMAATLIKVASSGLAAWWYEHREMPREQLVEIITGFFWLGFERLQQGERYRNT